MGDIFLGVQTLVWELRPSAQTKVWTPSPTLHHYQRCLFAIVRAIRIHPLLITQFQDHKKKWKVVHKPFALIDPKSPK